MTTESTPTAAFHRGVPVPAAVLVSFPSGTFTIEGFRLDLAERTIGVAADLLPAAGTAGVVTFGVGDPEHAFPVDVVVARVEGSGLLLRIVALDEERARRLRALVEGDAGAGVAEAIRRSVATGKGTWSQELRERPIDQKLMLALVAHGPEIDALIRDGVPSVLVRLLDGPRLSAFHVGEILRGAKVPAAVLSAIRQKGRLATPEHRFLFCTHGNAVLTEAMAELRTLPADLLRKIATNPSVKPQLRMIAQDLARR